MNKPVRDLLIAQIKVGLGLGAAAKVVWSQRPAMGQPAAKAPERPYATIQIVTSTLVHLSGTMPPVGAAPVPEDDLKTYLEIREAQVTVAVFTALDHDALDALDRLQRHLITTGSRSALRAQKIVSAGTAGASRDVSTFRDAAWEGRAELDLVIRWTVEWTADDGVIEAARFELDLDGSPVIVDVTP